MMDLTHCYPDITPHRTGMLPVDDNHLIYWEASGNPDGVPVVFLHGGPGGGTRPANRRFFDPDFFRIILLDQRGCGQSRPWGRLEDNSAPHLVADLEALRAHLGIERWAVAGGSWGSCLALLYGEAHPERCLGFRLRGVFTGRAREISWWWNHIGTLFPDAAEGLLAALPAEERADPLTGYYRRLIDSDPAIHEPAAVALKRFSASTVSFRADPTDIAAAEDVATALPLARFFTAYCVNRFFMPEGEIQRRLHRVAHLPCEIVQGRYDVVTPPATAWEIHRDWPGSTIDLVTEGGHAEFEPAMAAALRAATDRLRDRLR